jgi:cell division protein FtsL
MGEKTKESKEKKIQSNYERLQREKSALAECDPVDGCLFSLLRVL